MPVNMYDLAARMPIINTYVPIDFGELYRVATALREQVLAAQDRFTNYITTYGDFTSPSDVDTENWYNLTINRPEFRSIVDRASLNPDYLKDAAFLSEINSLINSTDYASLGRLRQSRENMLTRQAAVLSLIEQNRYNPLIHDMDYSNYDTLSTGLFSDTNPLPYTSIVDLVEPYVNNLKSEFIGTQGGWILTGVTPDRTDAQLTNNWSNIVNTPAYTQNLEIIQRMYPELTPEEAQNLLDTQILTAGREFAYVNQERDPWWMKSAELQMRASLNGAGAGNGTGMKNLTTLLHEDAKRMWRTNYGELSPDAKFRYINYGVDALTEDERKIVEEDTKPENIIKKNQQIVTTVLQANGNNFLDAFRSVVDYNSFPISDVAANIVAKMDTNGDELSFGGYRTTGLRRFILEEELGANMSGIDVNSEDYLGNTQLRIANNNRRRLWNDNNIWNGDEVDNIIIQPRSSAVSDNSRVYTQAYAYIPYDQASKQMTDTDIQLTGGSIVTLSPDLLTSVNISRRYDDDNNLQSTTRSETRKEQRYVRYRVVIPVSDYGERSIASDALYNKEMSYGTETRDTQGARSQYERSSIFNYIPSEE